MKKIPDSQPEISVIVPCYGHSAELTACLTSLANQSTNISYEVIVVDSASDPAVKMVVSQFPKVLMIRSKNRLFCGAAKDLGTKHVKAEFLAFTDSDCIPDPEWVENAYQTLQRGEQMVGGPVLDALPNQLIAITDNLLQFVDVPPGRPPGPIQHIPGCNMAIRKEAYQKAGGLPPRGSGDDVTLTMQINKIYPQGIFFNPSMRVAHLGRRTLPGLIRHQKLFGYTRGEMGLYITNTQQKLGRYWLFLPAVVLKRFLYLFKQIITLNINSLLRNLLLSPIILLGLTAWAVGFREGCKRGYKSSMELL